MKSWDYQVQELQSCMNEYSEPEFMRFDDYRLDRHLMRRAAEYHGMTYTKLGSDNHHYLISSEHVALAFNLNMAVGTPFPTRVFSNNKHLTKMLLSAAGVSVPNGRVFTELDAAARYLARVAQPMVVKPRAGSKGKGITLGVTTRAELETAWKDARKVGKSIILERYIPGDDLRIMVVGGQAIAATYRIPANVTGDGRSTIAELTTAKNAVRARNPHLRTRLIRLTPASLRFIARNGFATDSAPEQGQRVFLNNVANLSQGGDSVSVLDLVHPSFLRLAEQAIAAFPGLEHGGVDIVAADFGADALGQLHGVCEINANNVIQLHHFPLYGPPVDVADRLVRWYAFERQGNIRSPLHVRRKVTVSGKVQQVGYRKWLEQTARAHDVAGWVRNLGTDQVEAELSGPEPLVSAVILAMWRGPAKAVVDEVRVETLAPQGLEILPSKRLESARTIAFEGRDMEVAQGFGEATVNASPPISGSPAIYLEALKLLGQTAADSHLVETAVLERGLAVARTSDTGFEMHADGRSYRCIRSRFAFRNDASALAVTSDKRATREVLEAAGIPVAPGAEFVLEDTEAACRGAAEIGWPVVVKPCNGTGGVGVTAGITDRTELVAAVAAMQSNRLARTRNYSGRFVLERHVEGEEIRVYVVDDKALSAILKQRAAVDGDGKRSVAQLMEAANALRAVNPRLYKTKLKRKASTTLELQRQGLDYDSVPEAGRKVFLSTVASVSQGGESLNVIDQTHPDILKLAVESVRAIHGLLLSGIDLIVEDYTRPPEAQNLIVLEANASPSILTGVFPLHGPSADLGGEIADLALAHFGLPAPAALRRSGDFTVEVTAAPEDTDRCLSFITELAGRCGLQQAGVSAEAGTIQMRLHGESRAVSVFATALMSDKAASGAQHVHVTPTP